MELIVLVLEVILIVIKLKISPEESTRAVARLHGVPYLKLWEVVSKHWKKF